jgi:uncharacterized protein
MRRRVRTLFASGLLVFVLLDGAAAGPFEDGRAASNRGDYAAAIALVRPLAEGGDAKAQALLGFAYFKVHGVPQDDAEAAFWYRKAADQGYAWAQQNLGFEYGNGQGLPQDYILAHMWSNLAAADAETRDQAARNRDLDATKMTPGQIAEAQKMAREWKPK